MLHINFTATQSVGTCASHANWVFTSAIFSRRADKVVPKAGLVITIYDILDISGGFIYPSDGAAIYDVKFRLVVFLPFVGEVLVGRLVKSTR